MKAVKLVDPLPSTLDARLKQQLHIELDHVAHHELIKAKLSLFHPLLSARSRATYD